MRTRSVCRCLLCQLEVHLKQQFGETRFQEQFAKIAASGSLLAGFPSAFALTAHLRSCRSNGNGMHPADPVLREILHLRRRDAEDTLLRDILLLAFIPVLHSASRQLNGHYPLLSSEDTLQHLVASFLEALDSDKLLARESHVAFAISRMAKRNAFDWAERQTRIPGNAERDEPVTEFPDAIVIPELVERAVLLRHFLSRCQREGLLTATDMQLLVHIKLEGLDDRDGQYSNAVRQKIKRLLAKLRNVAQTARTKIADNKPSEPI